MPDLYAALLAKATGRNHPIFAALELTHECNLACRYCYNPIQRKGQARSDPPPAPGAPPLSFEEILGLMDQLREMGVLYLTLTGGEPMVHPRFWDIAREAKRRSFAVRVFTNGTLIDEAAAARFRDLCPYCLEISLHGATAETAERQNQVPGSYGRLRKALELLRGVPFRVYLKCVVTREVEGELLEMKALAEGVGFPIYFDPVITISDDGQEYPLEQAASDEALELLYRSDGLAIGNSPFDPPEGALNCTVASGFLHVDPYGNIQPCTQWKESAGNIREKPLRRIWEESPVMEYARKVNREVLGELRRENEESRFCFHCPALSQLKRGDARRLDEQYSRVGRIRKRVFRKERLNYPEAAAGSVDKLV